MIQKVTIVKYSLKEDVSKTTNKPYVKVGIRTNLHGEKWLGCFVNEFNKAKLTALKEGDVVDIVVEQNGDFLNFKLPTRTDLIEAELEKVKQFVGYSDEPVARATRTEEDF